MGKMKICALFLLLSLTLPLRVFAELGVNETLQKQVRTITGTVISSEDNYPVIGASIMQKGTTIGVITNVDGQFTINLSSKKGILEISYLGLKTKEVSFDANTKHIDVTLDPDTEVLEEVVVVGAGTQKKVSITEDVPL